MSLTGRTGVALADVVNWQAIINDYVMRLQDFGGLSQTDKATYALINQVAETVVGLGAIALVTAKSRPLPDDLFRFDLRCGKYFSPLDTILRVWTMVCRETRLCQK